MPRSARVVAVGVPHHLTQRGNNRQNIFLVDDDRRAYLARLEREAERCGMRLLGYCLMTNHVHLIAVPLQADSLARSLRRAHSGYAQEFNRRYRRTGHLFQNRFFSCALGPGHLATALLYVDCNPVRAALVGEATEYPWSSAAAHVAGGGDPLIDWGLWREVRSTAGWGEALGRGVAPELESRIRTSTLAGTPLGDNAFIERLERQAGRRLRPRKPGRKSKTMAAGASERPV